MIAQTAMSIAGRSVEVHTVGTRIRYIHRHPRTGLETVETATIALHYWQGDRFAGYGVQTLAVPNPVVVAPGNVVTYL